MATVTDAACGSSDGESENEPDGPASVDFTALAALGLGNGALEALKEHLQDHAIGGHTHATSLINEPYVEDKPQMSPSQATSGTVEVSSNLDFKLKSYWDERFAVEESYEWLSNFEAVKPLLLESLPASSTNPRILLVGCGNSRLSLDLVNEGFSNTISTDFSEVCIAAMQKQHPSLEWQVADMLTLEDFDDSSFDVVLDKAAMDALMCDEGSVWDPNPKTRADAAAMCRAVSRVLRNGGLFIQISFAQPHFRKRYLTNFIEADGNGDNEKGSETPPYGWDVSHRTVGEEGCLENFFYICKKR